MLERYEEIKASDAYKNTPGYRFQELFAQLNRENGYNDVFIPAMRRLSSSYREYDEKSYGKWLFTLIFRDLR